MIRNYFNEFFELLAWFVVVCIIILALGSLQGCKTTKEISKEASKEEVKQEQVDESTSEVKVETNTATKETSETFTEESFDTLVSVQVPAAGGGTTTIKVPVTGHRKTHRKEFSDQKQEKKEKQVATSNSASSLEKKSEGQTIKRNVKRTIKPLQVLLPVGFAIAVLAVLIWRLKLFRRRSKE